MNSWWRGSAISGLDLPLAPAERLARVPEDFWWFLVVLGGSSLYAIPAVSCVATGCVIRWIPAVSCVTGTYDFGVMRCSTSRCNRNRTFFPLNGAESQLTIPSALNCRIARSTLRTLCRVSTASNCTPGQHTPSRSACSASTSSVRYVLSRYGACSSTILITSTHNVGLHLLSSANFIIVAVSVLLMPFCASSF